MLTTLGLLLQLTLVVAFGTFGGLVMMSCCKAMHRWLEDVRWRIRYWLRH